MSDDDARRARAQRHEVPMLDATHPKNDTVMGTTASVLKTHGNDGCQRSSMILAVVLPSVLQNGMACAIARRKTRRHDMFRPSRGRITQRRHNDGPDVRALLSLPSLLLLLSLDNDDNPASVPSSPLQSPPPPRRRPQITTAPCPPPTTPARLPQVRARPPPPTLSLLNDNSPPPCRIRQRRTPLSPR